MAERARCVRIVAEAVEAYAQTLPTAAEPAVADRAPTGVDEPADLKHRAAHALTLNAINFGSGWFPTLRKRPGMSGYRTVEAGVREHGPWPAETLARITSGEVATVLDQDPDHELVGLFADHLRELGARVRDEHRGSFLALARHGAGSAVRLAEHLAGWAGWRDVAEYAGRDVPFFKRAQIVAFELARAGVAPARDLDRLTMFADNLVPHVLRIDGVLELDQGLVARIEREELIEPGSAEEVEIRACAVHAVELLVAAHGSTNAATVDNHLWHRGAGARYKAAPRHRTRTTAY